MKKNDKLNKGFTLVETLVAISIFTVSLLGMMSVLGSSIANTNYAKQKMVASYLAQEGIEYVRNKRDTAVLTSVLSGRTGLDGWNAFSLTPPLQPLDSSFTRTVSMTPVSTLGVNEVKITSTVTWNQGSGPKSVTFSENLFNWVE